MIKFEYLHSWIFCKKTSKKSERTPEVYVASQDNLRLIDITAMYVE